MPENTKETRKVITFSSIVFIIIIALCIALAWTQIFSWTIFFIIFGIIIVVFGTFFIVWWFKLRKKKEVEVKEIKEIDYGDVIKDMFNFARLYWLEPNPNRMEITSVSVGSPPTQIVYCIFEDYWDEKRLPNAVIMSVADRRKSIVLSRMGSKIKTDQEFMNEVINKVNAIALRPAEIRRRIMKTYKPETGAEIEVSEEVPAEKIEEEKERKAEEERKSM